MKVSLRVMGRALPVSTKGVLSATVYSDLPRRDDRVAGVHCGLLRLLHAGLLLTVPQSEVLEF